MCQRCIHGRLTRLRAERLVVAALWDDVDSERVWRVAAQRREDAEKRYLEAGRLAALRDKEREARMKAKSKGMSRVASRYGVMCTGEVQLSGVIVGSEGLSVRVRRVCLLRHWHRASACAFRRQRGF